VLVREGSETRGTALWKREKRPEKTRETIALLGAALAAWFGALPFPAKSTPAIRLLFGSISRSFTRSSQGE
jgi:hypothetical protein